MQFRHGRVEDCYWTTRYLSCWDIIFHQVTGKTDYVRQSRNGQTPDKWVKNLWFKVPKHDKEIGQRHDFHDFKMMRDKYLRNLDKIDPMDEGSDTFQTKYYRHMQEEMKTDKMSKLRREVEFVERGMQRVRTKLKKSQQDPTLKPSMTAISLRLRQFIDQHDYHEME